ncbi:peptide/nickel transport system permease protein [Pseudovibrio denitrificans]|uniref:Peptide/nickel transport system permease protein n=1 Tax=Pseudovibrio denitrificans TaxID=258256 RepID=A0A1I7DG79_9HYPH|nr:ABC transporter permease [Pseudovibrio denitrificans]SFU10679.1 peptide/nickel transport system permease protein [Pseudovibrio denitrificans]
MVPPILINLLSGLSVRLLVFFLLVLLVFFLPRLLPGDPVAIFLSSDLSRDLSGSEAEELRSQFGVAGGWLQQLGEYLSNLVVGDLGYSVPHAAPVSQLLKAAIPWTLLLIACAAPLFLIAGAAGGIEAGKAPGALFDRVATGTVTVIASIPPFTAAVLLLLAFGILWPVLPAGGAEPLFPSDNPLQRDFDVARHAVLPVLALSLHEVSRFYFLARGEAITLSQRPFIINACGRGIKGWRLRTAYYGRSLFPVFLARMSDSLTGLFGAVLFVEIVFSYPGTGHLIYNAILDRDYVLLQGAVIVMAGLVLLLNWIIDAVATSLARRG